MIFLIIWLIYFVPMFFCYKSMFRYYSYGEYGFGVNKHIMDYIGPIIPILNIYILFALMFLNVEKKAKVEKKDDNFDWEEFLDDMREREKEKEKEEIKIEESVGIKFKF